MNSAAPLDLCYGELPSMIININQLLMVPHQHGLNVHQLHLLTDQVVYKLILQFIMHWMKMVTILLYIEHILMFEVS